MPNVRTAFQRRHYQAVAAILAAQRTIAASTGDMFALTLVDIIIGQFAACFAADNPRFSESRFIEAAQGK